MSGVLLRRLTSICPSCREPLEPYTHLVAGTRLRGCDPYRCRIARTVALAVGPRPAWFEPAPLTDRRTA